MWLSTIGWINTIKLTIIFKSIVKLQACVFLGISITKRPERVQIVINSCFIKFVGEDLPFHGSISPKLYYKY